MHITGIDHIVLTVSDLDATVKFYTQILGMTAVTDGVRHELHFGSQKINLHRTPGEFLPAAACPAPGTADFCLVADGPMEAIVEQIRYIAPIEFGPIPRTGARGEMLSVYIRDPDWNLVEISVYGDSTHKKP